MFGNNIDRLCRGTGQKKYARYSLQGEFGTPDAAGSGMLGDCSGLCQAGDEAKDGRRVEHRNS